MPCFTLPLGSKQKELRIARLIAVFPAFFNDELFRAMLTIFFFFFFFLQEVQNCHSLCCTDIPYSYQLFSQKSIATMRRTEFDAGVANNIRP